MNFIKGNSFLSNYYQTEDEKMIVVKEGNTWQVWKRYTKLDARHELTEGYSLEYGKIKTLKDAKETAIHYYN